MRRRHWIAVLSCALSGCALHPTQVQPIDPGGCPETLRQRISLSASVAQIRVPEGLTLPSGPVRLHAGTPWRPANFLRLGPLENPPPLTWAGRRSAPGARRGAGSERLEAPYAGYGTDSARLRAEPARDRADDRGGPQDDPAHWPGPEIPRKGTKNWAGAFAPATICSIKCPNQADFTPTAPIWPEVSLYGVRSLT